MSLRLIFCIFVASFQLCWAADPVAAQLAREARKAQDSGHTVRAYMLYAEAAARDPSNPTYRANRDALEPLAKLLSSANVEPAGDSSTDAGTEPANDSELQADSLALEEQDPSLKPLPDLQPNSSFHDFDLTADTKSLLQQVSTAYGVRALWDPQIQDRPRIRFQVFHADFHAALEALTLATHTFMFPISEHAVFFADDTEQKRAEFEPSILLTVPLPNSVDLKDLTEAVNAARVVLHLQTSLGFDSSTRTVIIRDHVSRARVAQSLLQALLVPKGQVSCEVQILNLDTDINYHYGVALPTSFNLYYIGAIPLFQTILPTFTSPMTFLTFGGGASIFGVSIANSTLFASYTKSYATVAYDATVVASDGQTADFHVGQQYPIPQSLSLGATAQNGIYNPLGQVTFEDLGLVLKVKPHVTGDGDIALEVDAAYKSLGAQTVYSVPEIAEREFKGDVQLKEGQWAILAGIDEDSVSITRNGIPGLAQIPGLRELLAENTRDHTTSNVLVVIKPTITRLPMSASISPQYLIGPGHGERVIL